MRYNQKLEAEFEDRPTSAGDSGHRNGRVSTSEYRFMEEQELPLIRITVNDISEANQLSLSLIHI